MPILLLGLVFVIGLFIYYLATTKVERGDFDEDDADSVFEEDNDLKKEENVIFLTGNIESMKEKYKNKK